MNDIGEYLVPFLGIVGLSAVWYFALFPSIGAGIILAICFAIFYTAACLL